MNNSEAIKREAIIENLYKEARYIVAEVEKNAVREHGFEDYIANREGLESYIVNLIAEARSEAFEEAIQALPENDIAIYANDYQQGGKDGYNQALAKIKEILMRLKGKNG